MLLARLLKGVAMPTLMLYRVVSLVGELDVTHRFENIEYYRFCISVSLRNL